MPIVNKEQLQKLRDEGWVVAMPPQGVHPVTEGLAEVAQIDIKDYPNAHFISLAFEGKCNIFILYPEDAVDYARMWIDELLDRTFFKLRLGIDCYEVRLEELSQNASHLVRPFAARLDFLAQVIDEWGGSISFDEKRRDGILEINYETKSKSTNRQTHLEELGEFEKLVLSVIEASSFVNGFGFSVVAKDIIDCNTMYGTPRLYSRIDFASEAVKPLFEKLQKKTLGSEAIQRLAELNAITSHRAQIVFGYEASVTLLRDKIDQHRGDAFRLGKGGKKKFKRDLREWIRHWLRDNQFEFPQEDLESLTLSSFDILNDGKLPTNKDCVLAALRDCLDEKDPDMDYLELLYRVRNDYAHNRGEDFTVEELNSVLRVLRKILKNIALS